MTALLILGRESIPSPLRLLAPTPCLVEVGVYEIVDIGFLTGGTAHA